MHDKKKKNNKDFNLKQAFNNWASAQSKGNEKKVALLMFVILVGCVIGILYQRYRVNSTKNDKIGPSFEATEILRESAKQNRSVDDIYNDYDNIQDEEQQLDKDELLLKEFEMLIRTESKDTARLKELEKQLSKYLENGKN